MKIIAKLQAGEYAPYTIMYFGLLPDDGLVLKHLRDNFDAAKKFILSLPEEKLGHRCAEGKWTIKETLVHIIDDERIYAYRALRFARGDETELPGFEQDEYATESGANRRDVQIILEEFQTVRMATISLFENLEDRVLTRKGVASGDVYERSRGGVSHCRSRTQTHQHYRGALFVAGFSIANYEYK